MCGSRKYPYSPTDGQWKFLGSGGVWIFSGTTQLVLHFCRMMHRDQLNKRSNLICWIEFNIAEMWRITQALSKSICPVTFCCWRNKLGGLSVLLTTYSVNRACSIFFVDRIWWCLYVLHFVLIDRTHYQKLPQETCGSKSMELQSFLKQLIFISYYAEMTLSWF